MSSRSLLAFVLHSHIPYCRKQGVWPFGEEWVFEAMAETYIPMLDLMAEALPAEAGACLSVAVSPILCEQLADDYMKQRFLEYIDARIAAARRDIERHMEVHDDIMASIAGDYLEQCEAVKRSFLERWHRDLVGAFRRLAQDGRIEIMTTAATHAYLPLLGDADRVRAQLRTGALAIQHHLGVRPKAAWLPELGYSPGALDAALQEIGVDCILVDPSSVRPTPGRSGAASLARYTLGGSDMRVLVRDDVAVAQVWSPDTGYPGDGAYREFHKRHELSGIPYWRVTSKLTALDYKQLYRPQEADAAARRHAEHFCQFVAERVAGVDGGLVVAPFDMELFGHWWHEGVTWLSHVIHIVSESAGMSLASVSRAADEGTWGGDVELTDGSWGEGPPHSNWTNNSTRSMWTVLRDAHALKRQLDAATVRLSPRQLELAAAASRELMLAEASDWPYLVGVGQASEYARARFRAHVDNFMRLARAALDSACDDASALRDIAAQDEVFRWAPTNYL